jgi:hypothetical protein
MPDREYPAGALEYVARRLAVDRYGKAMATAVLADDDLRIGRVALDALAAVSPEDRAALARWVWPEGHEGLAYLDESLTSMRAERDAIEAATVKRITAELREQDPSLDRGWCLYYADSIDRKFGGPDAVK